MRVSRHTSRRHVRYDDGLGRYYRGVVRYRARASVCAVMATDESLTHAVSATGKTSACGLSALLIGLAPLRRSRMCCRTCASVCAVRALDLSLACTVYTTGLRFPVHLFTPLVGNATIKPREAWARPLVSPRILSVKIFKIAAGPLGKFISLQFAAVFSVPFPSLTHIKRKATRHIVESCPALLCAVVSSAPAVFTTPITDAGELLAGLLALAFAAGGIEDIVMFIPHVFTRRKWRLRLRDCEPHVVAFFGRIFELFHKLRI